MVEQELHQTSRLQADQLNLTRMIDMGDLLRAGALETGAPGQVSSAGTLVRGLRFLSDNLGTTGRVYPTPR